MISSRRYTTNSRRPGVVVSGVVYHGGTGLRVCEDCGHITSASVPPGQHAPHLSDAGRVNCVGRLVR